MRESLWLGSHAVPEAAVVAPAAAVAHAAAACLHRGLQSRGTEEGRGVWRAERMIGGAQLSVGKMEAQFTQRAGVEAHIWVSKCPFRSPLLNFTRPNMGLHSSGLSKLDFYFFN